MRGQHANVKGAALTVQRLLERLLAETRDELDAERKPPYGRHAVTAQPRPRQQPATA
jgi:hypothetical protein